LIIHHRDFAPSKNGVSDQEAIEGIAVVVGQFGEKVDSLVFDTRFLEASVTNCIGLGFLLSLCLDRCV
jgi:hypothetical protein